MNSSDARQTFGYESEKSKCLTKVWMTIFTPTYQRRRTMSRAYASLLNLRLPKDKDGKEVMFEWLIVNDGSTDGTEELVKQWIEENKLPIKYFYQKNQGKHVAENFAISHCQSKMILTLDSDDVLLPNALEIFYSEWQKIEDKENFKGVTGRSIDPESGKKNGSDLPRSPFDVNTMDMRLKYHIKGEMCGFNRVDIMRTHPFPTPDPRMRFCPENIVYYEIAKRYKERLVDIPVREYYKDTENAITGKNTNRAISNYYGWKYGVNNLLRYIFYSPKEVLKQFVGISKDGFRIGRSVMEILKDVNTFMGKILVLALIPIGFLLSKDK